MMQRRTGAALRDMRQISPDLRCKRSQRHENTGSSLCKTSVNIISVCVRAVRVSCVKQTFRTILRARKALVKPLFSSRHPAKLAHCHAAELWKRLVNDSLQSMHITGIAEMPHACVRQQPNFRLEMLCPRRLSKLGCTKFLSLVSSPLWVSLWRSWLSVAIVRAFLPGDSGQKIPSSSYLSHPCLTATSGMDQADVALSAVWDTTML